MRKVLLTLALMFTAFTALDLAQNPVTIQKVGTAAVTTELPTKSADGSNVTTGAKTDAKSTATDTTAASVISLLKEISFIGQNPPTFAVSGTFWQATQPVSLASVPSHNVTNTGTFQVQASQTATWNISNISGTISLPTGASTSAKQPALGTAGVQASDVLTVQGDPSMVALITTPYSYTAAANLQTSATANGNGSVQSLAGIFSSVVFSVTCTTCSGGTTVNFEATQDNVNYVPLWATQSGTNTIASSTTTAGVTVWGANVTNVTRVRARISAYSAGTISVNSYAGTIPESEKVVNANIIGTVPISYTQGALVAGTALIGKVGIDQTTPGTTNAVAVTNLPTAVDTNSGNKSASTPRFVIATDQPALTNPLLTQATPGTTNGLTPFTVQPGASDNHQVIKNGAGLVYHIASFNNSATINYFRLYDAGTGFNGCNSATNLKWSGHIPASTSDTGFVEDIGPGITFSTGISLCITGAYGQTNTTNATATAIDFNVGYK